MVQDKQSSLKDGNSKTISQDVGPNETKSSQALKQNPVNIPKTSKKSQANASFMFPDPDESILKNTKLLQVRPVPEPIELDEAGANSVENNPQAWENCLDGLWQGIETEKVQLNKYLTLSYISEENLKIIVERLHIIEVDRQKKFKKIIKEMQQNGNQDDSHKYSSQISNKQVGYSSSILFIDFSRYLKSLFHRPTRRILQMADLLYPQGILMQWAFRTLLDKPNETQHHHDDENSLDGNIEKAKPSHEFLTKFDFTVSLLSDLDEYHGSIFLIGGSNPLISKVENIFKVSFSNIKILGRYTAKYRNEKCISEIRTVINKATPTMLLVARGASIYDFVDNKDIVDRIASFLVVDYPEALHDFSGRYQSKHSVFRRILQFIAHLVFPWKWPKLLCILIFFMRISFLTLFHEKNKH